MSEFELGPSSLSTLQFTPHYLKVLLQDNCNDLNDDSFKEEKNNHNKTLENKTHIAYNSSINLYSLRSKTKSNRRSINRKAMSDHETMAFVAMRDILKKNPKKLAKLYNYNKREYDTFQAVLNNKKVNYKNVINREEVVILYHFFARICNKKAWMEICDDLGYGQFFDANHIKELFCNICNLQIRAKDEKLFELRFFMKLLIFFWDNLSEIDVTLRNMSDFDETDILNCNFTYFWMQSLCKTIHFISDLNVGINIEVYCLLKKEWISATIINMNKSSNQIYVQYIDGSNKHKWLSVYSDRLSPIGFKYFYIPNINKRNNVPCITSVIDDKLNDLAPKRSQQRNKLSTNMTSTMNNVINKNNKNRDPEAFYYIPPSKKQVITEDKYNIIPKQGWFYKSCANKKVGPVSIGMLFTASVTREINQNSIVYHKEFGTTTLNKLPHVVNVFRIHVAKCKQYHDLRQNRQKTELSIFKSFKANKNNAALAGRN